MAPQPPAPMPQQHHMQQQQMPPQQPGMAPGGQQGGDWRTHAQAPPKDNRLKTTVRPAPVGPAGLARPLPDPRAHPALGVWTVLRRFEACAAELTVGPVTCAGCDKH